jgi:hypothetical protein
VILTVRELTPVGFFTKSVHHLLNTVAFGFNGQVLGA